MRYTDGPQEPKPSDPQRPAETLPHSKNSRGYPPSQRNSQVGSKSSDKKLRRYFYRPRSSPCPLQQTNQRADTRRTSPFADGNEQTHQRLFQQSFRHNAPPNERGGSPAAEVAKGQAGRQNRTQAQAHEQDRVQEPEAQERQGKPGSPAAARGRARPQKCRLREVLGPASVERDRQGTRRLPLRKHDRHPKEGDPLGAQGPGYPGCGQDRIWKDAGLPHARAGEAVPSPMDLARRPRRPDYFAHERTGSANLRSAQEDRTVPQLLCWPGNRREEPERRGRATRAHEHSGVHARPYAATSGPDSRPRCDKSPDFGFGRGRQDTGHGFQDSFGCPGGALAQRTTDAPIFRDTKQTDLGSGPTIAKRPRVYFGPRTGRVGYPGWPVPALPGGSAAREAEYVMGLHQEQRENEDDRVCLERQASPVHLRILPPHATGYPVAAPARQAEAACPHGDQPPVPPGRALVPDYHRRVRSRCRFSVGRLGGAGRCSRGRRYLYPPCRQNRA